MEFSDWFLSLPENRQRVVLGWVADMLTSHYKTDDAGLIEKYKERLNSPGLFTDGPRPAKVSVDAIEVAGGPGSGSGRK